MSGRPGLRDLVRLARAEIRHGRFQRSMALVAAFSAIVSGFEAYVQHDRGAFEDRWMWTPVALVPPVVGAAAASVASERAARTVLPAVAAASLVDGVLGFGLHLRGIARMPGGFRLGQYNVVMGPPVFAPLLMSSVGVLGLLASALRPEAAPGVAARLASLPIDVDELAARADAAGWARAVSAPLATAIAGGRFQRTMALTAAGFAVLAGGEAYAEHLRGSFQTRLMWTPVWLTPAMAAAGIAAALDAAAAETVLPAVSAVTFADGLLGFGLHLRGLARMPGGFSNLRFNLTLGPPLFAPLLFTSVGMLGLLATVLRRREGR